MRRKTMFSVVSVAAMCALCGTPASALADGPPIATVSITLTGQALGLDGKEPFYTTGGVIQNVRVVEVPGTPAVIILWDEKSVLGAARSMYAISLDGNEVRTVQVANYDLKLAYGSFDPMHGTPAVPPSLAAGPGNELHLVQFVATPIESMRQAVEARGGVIERYVADHAFVVRMNQDAREGIAAMPFVRWVGPYHPAYRLDASSFTTLTQNAGAPPARYSIETMRRGPAQQMALRTLILSMGGRVDVMTLDQFRMEATLTPAQLAIVAQRNEVNFIDPWLGPGGTDMDIIRQLGGAVPILSTAGFLGEGVRGEIFDTGVVPNHQQWNGQVPLTHLATTVGNHGNACYGINFATGTGNALATGLNPNREQGIVCFYTSVTQFGGATTRLTANTQAVDPGGPFRSCYQTSSVGSPQISTYSTISAETDDYLFKVDYLSCQSQSNTGSTASRPQAWAKNMMSVGGIDHKNTLPKADDTSSGASFGPASDGRQKPDLAHSYLQVFTTYSTSPTGYGQFSGTSSATPITAGHFGLLHQMWHEGVWSGHGGGASVFDSRPKSTTAKALMINNAYRYPLTQGNLTRVRQGWGMADVGAMYEIRVKTFIVNESDALTPLASKAYNILVQAGEPELRCTMVYLDPQGNPAVQSQHRINNLDMKVTSPTGTVYYGNNGLSTPNTPAGSQTNYSTPGGNPDTKNTVENVFIQNPAKGLWTVEIIGTEIVQDARLETPEIDADFALVVTGGNPFNGCYPDCNGDTLLNIHDYGCFQNRFALSDPWADCDGDGLLNLADFTCYVSKFKVGCP